MKSLKLIHILLTTLLVATLVSCGDKNNSQTKTDNNQPSDQVWVVGEGQVNGDVDFGEINPGQNKVMSLTIKNMGAVAVNSPLQVSGDFSIAYQNGCSTLAINKSCLVKLSFSSSNKVAGPYVGQIQLGEYIGLLSAVVLPQNSTNDLSIKVNSVEVDEEIDFGNLNYKQSVIKTIIIKNNSAVAIQVNPTIGGADFSKVFDNCLGKTLKNQNQCSVKVLVAGQGKNGLIENELTLGDKVFSLKAQVVGRDESVEMNSQIVSIVDNQTVASDSTVDLGTVNTNSQVSKTFYLKNSGIEQSPLINTTISGTQGVTLNQCDNIVLNPNQACRLQTSIPTSIKGVSQLSLVLNGYQSSKQYNIEYIVRSPGDKIDCTAGLSDVALAEITWTGSVYTPCQVVTCNSNHHIANNQCDKDVVSCSAYGGNGNKTWNGSEYGDCIITTCQSASQHIENNLCVDNVRSCSIAGAVATETWMGTSYGPCTANSCTSASQHVENNMCLDNVRSCTITGAVATETWNGSGYNPCTANSCISSGDHVVNNACVPKNYSVTITQPAVGRGTISGPATVQHGSNANFTYSPQSPYRLSSWAGDCTGTNNTCSVNNIQGNLNVSANIACISGYTMVDNECLRNVNLIIASNTTNYNLYTAASSPTDKVLVSLTINSGIVVGSGSTDSPSFTTGSGWVSGSKINIVNNGTIAGKGGNGGHSDTWTDSPGAGSPGGYGGNAVNLLYPITLTNTGLIGGGGGGGGGGTGGASYPNYCWSGGGGGGGAGSTASIGGSAQACGSGKNAGPGQPGTLLVGGNGAPQASWGSEVAGAGGKGGDLGMAGTNAGTGSGGNKPRNTGGLGGAAGKAIVTNGNAITWISGNEPAKVKGLVQ